MVPIPVYPRDAAIHIGLSYNSYSLLTASNVEQMSNCTSIPGPVAQGIDLERQCQSGVSGHYVYVFIEGRLRDKQLLDIWELQMYADPGTYVHRVNTTSETHACRTTQIPPHMQCILEWSLSGHCMLTLITPQGPGPSKRWLKKTLNERRFQIHLYPPCTAHSSGKPAWIFIWRFWPCPSNDMMDINDNTLGYVTRNFVRTATCTELKLEAQVQKNQLGILNVLHTVLNKEWHNRL